MTAVAIHENRLPAVLALAIVALAARGVGTWSFAVPLIGATGVLAVQPRPFAPGDRRSWLLVTAFGVGACATVRLALPGVPVHATVLGLVASVAAAIGEEIIFRRGLYGTLERHGPLVAVVTTALVFGLVHVPMYGWAVVGVDVGAGLVFGWQRWMSGSWTPSAVTHAAANLMGAM
jgi:membrane protease YdiL (CAAX protease family)